MGRHKIAEEKKRVLFGASAEKQIVEFLGVLVCKEIAEKAVIKHYEKNNKNGKV